MHKSLRQYVNRWFFVGIFSLWPVLVLGDDHIVLPDIGDPSGSIITPLQEQELGEAFFRQLHFQIPINQDPEIQDYIQTLGQRLAENSDSPERAFRFFVVLDPLINAFAGPGGYIGINSGLISLTESESELASVIAHEIAHVTQRHLNRAFEATNRLSIPLAAATLAAILIGSQSGELGYAALIASQAGSAQYQINFTRNNEQEADRVGMKNLVSADFNPRSMPEFFERLQLSGRYYGREIPEFLRTHPVTVSRIADTRGRAEKFPYRQFPDSLSYLLAKAKLRVITAKTPESAKKYFTSILERGTAEQKSVAYYGLGLALVASSEFQNALRIFEDLSTAYPEQSQFAHALGQALIDSRNVKRASVYYENALKTFPNNRAMTLAYASALLQSENPAKAINIINQYRENRRTTPEIYDLLAQAYEILGNKAESHRYIAEYYYQIGQTSSAITQLKIATTEAKDDFHLTAIIEARRKTFELEEKDRNETQLH